MSNAPETKYTDRDVRENDSLTDAAFNYLEQYGGEFQFLIDCKMRVAQGVDLTTGMIRGVLNCMRVDPRVTNLPDPLPTTLGDDMAEVVSIQRKTARRTRRKECDIEGFHEPHGGYGSTDGYEYCPGRYAINRQNFMVPATMNVELLAARSKTSVIHKVNTESDKHYFLWWPYPHEYGFRFSPDLHVYTVCTYPRNVKNPILFNHEDIGELQLIEEQSRGLCKRCFSGD